MLLSIGIITVLLVLSAFFSGSETALTAASRPLMHQLAQNGDKRAEIVNQLHEQQERLIASILVGNNLVNIMATALATSVFFGYFGDAGVAYATLVMTLLVLIFAEILPKTYAFRNASQVAIQVAPLVRALVLTLAPIVRTIQFFTRCLFRLFGANVSAGTLLGSTAEELRGAIELHAADEQTIKEERAMLHSILDLTTVWVSEIMIHRKSVTTINADDPIREIVNQVLASPYSRIPLWRNDPDNVVGVLHSKALLRAVHEHGGAENDIDIVAIANSPWFIPESTSLLAQLQAFRERKEHFAQVVDEFGTLLGIVTLEDILEEIVGDISDEHDITVSGVRAHGDGTYSINGSVTLRDLNREFNWNLPDEEASTLAGLLLYESRRIPEIGQIFTFHDFRFEILRRQRNQITAIRVTPPEKVEAAGDNGK